MTSMAARPGTVPLARALSKLGHASRSDAHELVRRGHVSVDGRVVTDPACPVVPERARITIGGSAVARAVLRYIVLNKPRGYVTTTRDPEGRPTVMDLVSGCGTRVFPVGRLDWATSGVLLLTNDTVFSDWVTNPANAVPRVYVVTVRGALTDEAAAALQSGVVSRGERLFADGVVVRKRSARETHLLVTLSEGKNREVRRLFDAVGHEVSRLQRVSFGGVSLGSLEMGAWRDVTVPEIRHAFPGAPLRGGSRNAR
jgi:23S rRNA pseudouridine2605 synthase